jgi:hypothetical protein
MSTFTTKEQVWLRLVIRLMSKAGNTECERREKLVAKAREILAQPIAEAIVSKDGTVTIKPAGWCFVDVARMVQIAIELGMLAVGSTTKKRIGECSASGSATFRLRQDARSHFHHGRNLPTRTHARRVSAGNVRDVRATRGYS